MIITVLTSVHNGSVYLQHCIESVLRQTHQAFEFVIIDDGSTDASSEIIRRFAQIDSRIRPFYRTNTGLTASLNFGASMARGEYIARLDADDTMHERRLELTSLALYNQQADIVITPVHYIDESGRSFRASPPLSRRKIGRALLRGYSPFAHSAVTIRTSTMRQLGGYDELFRRSQDYELWFRMYAMDKSFHIIDQPLTQVRLHRESMTSQELDYYTFLAYVKNRGLLTTYHASLPFDQTAMVSAKSWLQTTIIFKLYRAYRRFTLGRQHRVAGWNEQRDQSTTHLMLLAIPAMLYRALTAQLLFILHYQYRYDHRPHRVV